MNRTERKQYVKLLTELAEQAKNDAAETSWVAYLTPSGPKRDTLLKTMREYLNEADEYRGLIADQRNVFTRIRAWWRNR